MVKLKVKINSISDVKEFCNLSTRQIFDIDIVSGRYIIDAKSIMGLFSLDLSKALEVNVHATEDEAKDFIKALDKFIVK